MNQVKVQSTVAVPANHRQFTQELEQEVRFAGIGALYESV